MLLFYFYYRRYGAVLRSVGGSIATLQMIWLMHEFEFVLCWIMSNTK